MRIRSALVAVALPLALVAACGGDTTTASDPGSSTGSSADPTEPTTPDPSASASTEPTPSETATTGGTTSPEAPACDEVWVDGQRLPGSYEGCTQGERLVKPDGRYCEFGKQLFTYDQRFWAVKGGRISEATEAFATDPGYQDALKKCTA